MLKKGNKFGVCESIVADFLIEQVGPLERSHDHLTEHRLLLLEVSELLLEVVILLLLVYHAQLETAVEGLNERSGGCGDLLIYVVYFGLHGVQLLPEELDQLVILLKVLICLPR